MGIKEKIRMKANKKKQGGRSIYFILWAALSLFSLVILLLIAGTQQFAAAQSFRYEFLKSVSGKGKEVKAAIERELPSEFGGDYGLYIRYLSDKHNVIIFVLDGDGEVLLPQDQAQYPQWQQDLDFSQKVVLLKERLAESNSGYSVFVDDDGDYVYGTKLSAFEGDRYLYLAESSELAESVIARTSRRVWVVALFLFILSFAVSSAVSGWLIKPLSVMTEKARRLAEGDFNVDFKIDSFGEMQELAETLNFARTEIFKADKMQKELIANVSHDFKTPLTMIKAYASMILEISGDDPVRRNKHAQVIIDESDRLASLVSDVLDLSKIRAGIDELTLAEVDVSAYLSGIIERFTYLSEEHGYRFDVDVENGLKATVDEGKIGQVLYNLIGNAVNYTGEDKRIKILLKSTDEKTFRFAVTDSGKGLSEEEKQTIWERYYRSNEMHKRPVQGTGLGLSIVKAVLEKHAFAFGVESETGKGSTFFVDFPKTEEKGKKQKK